MASIHIFKTQIQLPLTHIIALASVGRLRLLIRIFSNTFLKPQILMNLKIRNLRKGCEGEALLPPASLAVKSRDKSAVHFWAR
jgi:hypothetical protein